GGGGPIRGTHPPASTGQRRRGVRGTRAAGAPPAGGADPGADPRDAEGALERSAVRLADAGGGELRGEHPAALRGDREAARLRRTAFPVREGGPRARGPGGGPSKEPTKEPGGGPGKGSSAAAADVRRGPRGGERKSAELQGASSVEPAAPFVLRGDRSEEPARFAGRGGLVSERPRGLSIGDAIGAHPRLADPGIGVAPTVGTQGTSCYTPARSLPPRGAPAPNTSPEQDERCHDFTQFESRDDGASSRRRSLQGKDHAGHRPGR